MMATFPQVSDLSVCPWSTMVVLGRTRRSCLVSGLPLVFDVT